MKKIKRYISAVLLLVLCAVNVQAQITLEYESKPTDMIQMKCYRLSNGMHVYLHENHDSPRILTDIVVRAGSMQDTKDCTGLAHYMEHLFFHGTSKIGTLDYEKEKPLLDEIEELFEQYRSTTDEAQRKSIYTRIDALSYEASKYALFNEYSDVMNEIGAVGVNAFTSDKNTRFVSTIPSNEIERWAKLQSQMFSDFVIRGFHTELETVYEENNTSLHDDMSEIWQASDMMTFPNIYNKVKVIGTQHDLKNPSVREVYNFYRKYYVPENMAVCMSGSFDTEETLQILDRNFGQIKSSGEVPQFPVVEEIQPGTQGYKIDVVGPQVPSVLLTWRLPKPTDERSQAIMRYIDNLLCHKGIGIMHNEYVVTHAVVNIESGMTAYPDFSNYSLSITMNADDVLELGVYYAMQAVDSLALDNWDEALLDGIRKDIKRSWLASAHENEIIVENFIEDFTNSRKWTSVEEDDSLFAEITKEEIQTFAKKWLCDENLSVVYKRMGEKSDVESFAKPAITPLYDNSGMRTETAAEILATPTKPLEPEFTDYSKVISKHTLPDGNTLLYMKNTEDDLYYFNYYYNVSVKDLPMIDDAFHFMSLSSVDEPIQMKRFRLGFDSESMKLENGYSISGHYGLDESFAQAIEIYDNFGRTTNEVPMDAYRDMYNQILAYRELIKEDRDYKLYEMKEYGVYGKKNNCTNLLTEKDYKKHTPVDFYKAYCSMNDYHHTFTYYGPSPVDTVIAVLDKSAMANTTNKISASPAFVPQKVKKNEAWVKPFAGDNTSIVVYSCNGDVYKWEKDHLYSLFNNYIGSNDLGGPLLGELRGKRSLCYGASMELTQELVPNTPQYILGRVDCQNDKLVECLKTLRYVIDEMPLSRERFETVKKARLNELITERYKRNDALMLYWVMDMYDFKYNQGEYEYNMLMNTTFDDFVDFYNNTIRNRKYRYMILGNVSDEQREYLKTIAKVKDMK